MTVWTDVQRAGDQRNTSLLSLFFAYVAHQVRAAGPVAWRAVLRNVLTIGGLTCLVIAAFLGGLIIGFAVLGVALLVLEWAVKQ